MRYADMVPGTKVGFAYGASGHVDASGAHAARPIEATGFSRGARAILAGCRTGRSPSGWW